LTFNVEVFVFGLAAQRIDNFAQCRNRAWIRSRQLVFHRQVKLLQLVERNRRIDVVFDVVVHVPVDPAIERTHVNRARVEAMVDRVLGETRVLCRAKNDDEPVAVDAG